jgi:uncharacterized protein YaaN involved in tellurite resistance
MSESKVTTAEPQLAPTAPLPAAEVTSYAVATPERRTEIEQALKEIQIDDSNSILFFGTAAQGEVTAVADEMLEGVRNKDTGPAGLALSEMSGIVCAARLDIGALDPQQKRRGCRPAVRQSEPIAKAVLQRYEQSAVQDRHRSATGPDKSTSAP